MQGGESSFYLSFGNQECLRRASASFLHKTHVISFTFSTSVHLCPLGQSRGTAYVNSQSGTPCRSAWMTSSLSGEAPSAYCNAIDSSVERGSAGTIALSKIIRKDFIFLWRWWELDPRPRMFQSSFYMRSCDESRTMLLRVAEPSVCGAFFTRWASI